MVSISEHSELEQPDNQPPRSEAKAIIGAMTVILVVASAWIGFFFGIVQPWVEGAL